MIVSLIPIGLELLRTRSAGRRGEGTTTVPPATGQESAQRGAGEPARRGVEEPARRAER